MTWQEGPLIIESRVVLHNIFLNISIVMNRKVIIGCFYIQTIFRFCFFLSVVLPSM